MASAAQCVILSEHAPILRVRVEGRATFCFPKIEHFGEYCAGKKLRPHTAGMEREHHYYVYIMQSPSRRVLYIGVTGKIRQRVFQHKNHLLDGFSSKYNATRLVYLGKL